MAIIAGRAFPAAVAAQRRRLEARIRREGFEQAMEAMAYTWFNRLVAPSGSWSCVDGGHTHLKVVEALVGDYEDDHCPFYVQAFCQGNM